MSMPTPRETPTNAPMLSAWREKGQLALQRCEACGRTVFYPRSACPHCHAQRLTWFTAEGTGYVVSFSRIHRGLPDSFQAEIPIVLAEIALTEGALMIARVVMPHPEAFASGQAVRLVASEDASRYPLPTFRPA